VRRELKSLVFEIAKPGFVFLKTVFGGGIGGRQPSEAAPVAFSGKRGKTNA
jgi:hypothetical protein